MSRTLPIPFLRWAGGKGRMLGHILPHVPQRIHRFFEPFLGGGALFFELSRQKRFERAVLGDMNPNLMNAYRVVKSGVEDLIAELQSGKYVYNKSDYLKIRAKNTETLSEVERAARFIYLNRTCFNGLYRVNKRGGFNVPFGDCTAPVICDDANLREVSRALSKARLEEKDFSKVVRDAKKGDLVYFDPPYFPLSNTSKFVSYTDSGFGIEEHARLANTFSQLANKGVTTILSNSWCPTTLDFYRDFKIIELTGKRNIGGSPDYRAPVKEMMVVANTSHHFNDVTSEMTRPNP